jgi:predicted DCC family thiol-disulfide oxidoreductase YuxK
VIRLTLYSRRGCPLCDDMMIDLEMAARGRDLEFEVVDIESSADLVRRFGERIPVLCEGERELCHGHLDVAALNRRLHEET